MTCFPCYDVDDPPDKLDIPNDACVDLKKCDASLRHLVAARVNGEQYRYVTKKFNLHGYTSIEYHCTEPEKNFKMPLRYLF